MLRRVTIALALIAVTAGCAPSTPETVAADAAPAVVRTSPPAPVAPLPDVCEEEKAVCDEPDPAPEPVSVSPETLATLPRPALTGFLPDGLPQVTAADLTGYVAVPASDLTAAFASPDGEPVLALEAATLGDPWFEARWAVVGEQDGWVKVLTPAGRGALPSQDPARVNDHAAWVRADDVTLSPEGTRITIDVSDRTLTITHPDGTETTFPVGVGVVGDADTPLGVSQVVGLIETQAGVGGLLTSGQSERLDVFQGAEYAAIAIHVGTGQGRAVSNGCIRVTQADYENHLQTIPAGTPVVVQE